jgi:hypothetical protein
MKDVANIINHAFDNNIFLYKYNYMIITIPPVFCCELLYKPPSQVKKGVYHGIAKLGRQ